MKKYESSHKSYSGRVKARKILLQFATGFTVAGISIGVCSSMIVNHVKENNERKEYVQNALTNDSSNALKEIEDVMNVSFDDRYEDGANKLIFYYGLVSEYENTEDKDEKKKIGYTLYSKHSDINIDSLSLLKEVVGDKNDANANDVRIVPSYRGDPALAVIDGKGNVTLKGKDADFTQSISDFQSYDGKVNDDNLSDYVGSVKRIILDSVKLIEGKEKKSTETNRL